MELARATWNKILEETSKGRVGDPVDLDDFNLEEGLLVDTFGVMERHGSATADTLRIINNFRANMANEYADMPEKLSYDGFSELKQTCISSVQSMDASEF